MSSFDINDSLLVLCFMGWGVVMALCLFLAIIRALFSCIQKIYDGDYHTAGVQRYSGGETLELYRTMSSARKEEIDNLRKNALLRYLSGFTLVRLQHYTNDVDDTLHCLLHPLIITFSQYCGTTGSRRRTLAILLWITN